MRVVSSKKFVKALNKIRDVSVREKVVKQIQKILENPEVGKPLRYNLKGERTLYVVPFRLIYSVDGEAIYLLRFEHREQVYT